MEVVIRVTTGPHTGLECVFDRAGTYAVGRSSQVPFSVPEDRLMSREHFRIEVRPPTCWLQDSGSTNGTRVNGLRVGHERLRDGDVISAGGSSFEVRIRELTPSGHLPFACLGCGRTAPADTPRVETGWLCADCIDRRRSFPTTHPDYLIERRIGGGGMGEVFLAHQLSSNRPVAIKMMVSTGTASAKARDYFRREMQVLKDLLMPTGQCHPNIVAFYDIFEIDGQFQLIMEHVPGKNAHEWVDEFTTPLPITAAARIGKLLLSALQHAHSKGYVHRDIKPSNLLIMGPPQGLQVKLSDFGLAKSFRENAEFAGLTRQGDVAGSIGFLSPDHIRDFSEAKEPADLYGTGATLYYLLTRQYPFFGFDPHRGDAYKVILEHPSVPLRAHRPDAPEGLERVLRKALEKHPRDRWKSAEAMSEALRPFFESRVDP